MLKRCFLRMGVAAVALVLMNGGASRAQYGSLWDGGGSLSAWSATGGWVYWPSALGVTSAPPGLFNPGAWAYWPGGIGTGYVSSIYSPPSPWTYWPGGIATYGYPGVSMGTFTAPPPIAVVPRPSRIAAAPASAPLSYGARVTPVFTTRAPVAAPLQESVPTEQAATVEITAPADAVIRFDGHKTNQTGTRRIFTTPPLPKGQSYHYTVEATFQRDGKAVTQSQRVQVSAGAQKSVVFPLAK
jgi:uncharacterized protein (TIGR03000 family)